MPRSARVETTSLTGIFGVSFHSLRISSLLLRLPLFRGIRKFPWDVVNDQWLIVEKCTGDFHKRMVGIISAKTCQLERALIIAAAGSEPSFVLSFFSLHAAPDLVVDTCHQGEDAGDEKTDAGE